MYQRIQTFDKTPKGGHIIRSAGETTGFPVYIYNAPSFKSSSNYSSSRKRKARTEDGCEHPLPDGNRIVEHGARVYALQRGGSSLRNTHSSPVTESARFPEPFANLHGNSGATSEIVLLIYSISSPLHITDYGLCGEHGGGQRVNLRFDAGFSLR